MTTKPKRSRRNVPGPVPVPSRWGVPDPDICQHTVGASGRAVAERVFDALFGTQSGPPGVPLAWTYYMKASYDRAGAESAIKAAIERAMYEHPTHVVITKKRPARRGGTDGT